MASKNRAVKRGKIVRKAIDVSKGKSAGSKAKGSKNTAQK